MKKDDKDISVEAQCRVTSPNGVEVVRTFDRAWHRALELPQPVNIQFIAFVRKES
jgi:hypothetical protein